jgi:hypothetical protein
MAGVLCSMVGASFVTAVAEVIRRKLGITAVGNAQIDTAQSQFGGASALFDGTGDFLTVQNIAGGITADQTFEFWIRFANLPTSGGFRMVAGDGGGARYLGLLNDGGTYRWEVSFSDGQYVERFTTSVSTNTWYHVALTKSGSTLKMYQAGSALTSAVSFNTMSSEKTLFVAGTNYIGSWNTDSNFLNGWMDEIRVSNNVRYTSGFTPSTTPFVNDANTVLLIHADGTDATTFFEDDNGVRAQRGITAVGNAQIDTAQSQFGGASALFDGTGDRLDITAAANLAFGSSDFTIECWVRYSSVSGNQSIIDFRDTAANGAYILLGNNGGAVYLYVNGDYRIGNSGTQFATNTWYHVALSRSGTSTKLFINGTQSGSTYSDSNSYLGTSPDIGELNSSFGLTGFGTIGHIDEFRISNNARYTANFTAPTAPFVNDANTLLLLHMDGTDATTVFRDDNGIGRSAIGLSSINSTAVSTTQSKFGGTSAFFNNTNTTISTNSACAPVNFTTGDFTIEGWIYPTSNTAVTISNAQFGTTNGWTILAPWDNGAFYFSSANAANNGIDYYGTGSVFSLNSWQHFAICRTGTNLYLYANGNLAYSSSSFLGPRSSSGSLVFGFGPGSAGGSYSDSNSALYYGGYLDEIRISNNVRYTGSTYTIPTTQFQNDTNTVFLCHFDGTNNSTVFTDDNGTRPT